ncbi:MULTISPECIES: hypothetical protein, partial [unclassified Sinorhizobium]|uniref:hypothetical protein n=1 Tax=unclassified Sinorhizobium TaxID=2613772 RepID=UPI0024C28A71
RGVSVTCVHLAVHDEVVDLLFVCHLKSFFSAIYLVIGAWWRFSDLPPSEGVRVDARTVEIAAIGKRKVDNLNRPPELLAPTLHYALADSMSLPHPDHASNVAGRVDARSTFA